MLSKKVCTNQNVSTIFFVHVLQQDVLFQFPLQHDLDHNHMIMKTFKGLG